MYGQEQNSREMILDEYKADVEGLLRYLPWLHKISGQSVESYYEGNDGSLGFKVPVYDSTLLSFVKDAEKTKFVSKNYPYVYTRYQIKNSDDEIRLMKAAKIQEIDLFKAIISKYVLEGKRRGIVWSEAVSKGIFTTALDTLNDLFFRYAP